MEAWKGMFLAFGLPVLIYLAIFRHFSVETTPEIFTVIGLALGGMYLAVKDHL